MLGLSISEIDKENTRIVNDNIQKMLKLKGRATKDKILVKYGQFFSLKYKEVEQKRKHASELCNVFELLGEKLEQCVEISDFLESQKVESLEDISLEDLGSLEGTDIIQRYMELIQHVVLLPSTLIYHGTYGKNREKIEPEFPHQIGTHFYNPITSINFFFANLENSSFSDGIYVTGFPLKNSQLRDLLNNLNVT